MNNYRLASIHHKLKQLDEWVRNRLRYCIWLDWKKLERKRKNIIRLGVEQGQAFAWSRTRMGGWAVARSPILVTAITLSLEGGVMKVCWITIYDLNLNLKFNEPPSTRPVRLVV